MVAATGYAPISLTLDNVPASGAVATNALLTAMLRANNQVSDLIFSPGRPPQVEINGQLVPVEARGLRPLLADDTRRIAADLIGSNKPAITMLREQGSCDISYGLPGLARFRVNVFIQRGSCAVVMRVIPTSIPDFSSLGVPQTLGEIADLRDGIVLVTGGRGSGKSSTLAAILDRINQTRTCHIITIEDPIEFLHNHKQATVHQREVHSDAPSYTQALRSALRQAPNVILVGEIRDRETIEMAFEAAETGHLVLSTLNTVNAVQTIERIVNAFSGVEQKGIRTRLARTLRRVISQRLIPRIDGSGRVAVVELLKVNARACEYLEQGARLDETIPHLIKQGRSDGMQDFDSAIAELVLSGVAAEDTALIYSSDPTELRRLLQQ